MPDQMKKNNIPITDTVTNTVTYHKHYDTLINPLLLVFLLIMATKRHFQVVRSIFLQLTDNYMRTLTSCGFAVSKKD